MLEKYNNEFKEMYEKIFVNKEKPIEVINENIKIFESEGINRIGIIYYLARYSKEFLY